ncbi:MAG: copper resistance protein CopA [Nitrospira sp. ST-bin4]|nr:MAG: copper resistance protein CopA [Nitrospira sp. ST-bin4]
MQNEFRVISRRLLLKRTGALGLLAAMQHLLPACMVNSLGTTSPAGRQPETLRGEVIDLDISESRFTVGGRSAQAMTINGTVPGPLIRLKEGQDVTLRVTNRLTEHTSIHWHGILLEPDMDGVPGVSFGGIRPGETFIYRFPVRQSGTYWYHSHSGGQELQGLYAPMIVDPIEPDPFRYSREYVVMLSDWTFESPESLLGNLKKLPGYYNFQRRTLGQFLDDASRMGWWPTLQDYLMWDRMRMDPTDFADVTGYTFTYLMNGLSTAANWTGLARPGEKVRLRFINAAAMTFFDVHIPGVTMTVVQADGQNVQPVIVEEFRIGVAETFDVIVELPEDRAYTIFAETMDRSGYARGTLAPRAGMTAEIPSRRPRPVRTMADMGMQMKHAEMEGMEALDDMPGRKQPDDHDMVEPVHPGLGTEHSEGMHEMPARGREAKRRSEIPGIEPVKHGPDDHGTGNQMIAEYSRNMLHEPGRGLEGSPRRVLVYTDLKSLAPYPDQREPEREIELHVTGNMDRYMWSFDGKTYSEARDPIRFRYRERLRLTFVNDTMMEHPLHLHGMWMYLENGMGPHFPRKHTVVVKPAERLSVVITADAPGRWAFHCHLLLHMEAGMFRVVEVADNEHGGHS